MPRTLIVGYGNPLCHDDGFGWHAAEYLAARLASPDIEVIRRQQLTPELAETSSHFELIIFIDAAANLLPGELRCEKILASPRGEPDNGSSFSHFLTPASVLTWTAKLYGKLPDAYWISVGGASFAGEESISLAVGAAFEPLLEQVRVLLNSARALSSR